MIFPDRKLSPLPGLRCEPAIHEMKRENRIVHDILSGTKSRFDYDVGGAARHRECEFTITTTTQVRTRLNAPRGERDGDFFVKIRY